MTIKERIQALCKEKKISANKLEQELGFASGYISKLNNSTPNTRNMQKIADYFNVTVDYILDGGTVIEYEQKGKEHAELLRMYEMLTSDEKEQILNTMKLFLKNK